MRSPAPIMTLLLLLAGGDALAACTTMRFAYIDQHRPPYYLGSGAMEADPPGASVEMLREIATHGPCPITTMRLPHMRMRAAIESGQFDAMVLDSENAAHYDVALPRDQKGEPDPERAMRSFTVVYVRARDKLAADTDPLQYFRKHTLGTPFGAPHSAMARRGGLQVDDGARDLERNLDKLRLGRVDGVAASLVAMHDLDAYLRKNYRGQFVRLATPLRVNHIWMAVNKDYYATNKVYVDAMWRYIGAEGHVKFAALLKKYEGLSAPQPP